MPELIVPIISAIGSAAGTAASAVGGWGSLAGLASAGIGAGEAIAGGGNAPQLPAGLLTPPGPTPAEAMAQRNMRAAAIQNELPNVTANTGGAATPDYEREIASLLAGFAPPQNQFFGAQPPGQAGMAGGVGYSGAPGSSSGLAPQDWQRLLQAAGG